MSTQERSPPFKNAAGNAFQLVPGGVRFSTKTSVLSSGHEITTSPFCSGVIFKSGGGGRLIFSTALLDEMIAFGSNGLGERERRIVFCGPDGAEVSGTMNEP